MAFFRPLDVLILILLFFSAIISFISFKSVSGSQAEIRIQNKTIAMLDLNQPLQEREIPTRIGVVTIQYGEGSIRVISSPCTQKICLLQGAIESTHEHIICLPARMTISIINDRNTINPLEKIDAFSY
ncbi:NusG domain II-containing protein [bacterium]|nr:NusG domain II-containing protein [bacterium]